MRFDEIYSKQWGGMWLEYICGNESYKNIGNVFDTMWYNVIECDRVYVRYNVVECHKCCKGIETV
jgi:hypothetical protein